MLLHVALTQLHLTLTQLHVTPAQSLLTLTQSLFTLTQSLFTPAISAVLKQVRKEALKAITQTGTFKAEDGIDFTSARGVRFVIQPDAMSLNGVKVTGNVTLEFIELYKRGRYIYAVKDVTVEEDKVFAFEKGDMAVIDKDALIMLINNLPQ